MHIVTIIPALDEAGAIGGVVRAISRELVQEVIVVDNGSRDATAVVAQAAGATVIREPQRGYGSACLAGARAARQADILVFLDGDGSDDPTELPRVLQPILHGQADLVLGSRRRGQGDHSGLTPQQRVGNGVVTSLVRILYGVALTDIGPFRAITQSAFQGLRDSQRQSPGRLSSTLDDTALCMEGLALWRFLSVSVSRTNVTCAVRTVIARICGLTG